MLTFTAGYRRDRTVSHRVMETAFITEFYFLRLRRLHLYFLTGIWLPGSNPAFTGPVRKVRSGGLGSGSRAAVLEEPSRFKIAATLKLLPEINSICLLLPAVACCCLLLPAVACCCLLLPAVACCCLLLPAVACCCLLLPATAIAKEGASLAEIWRHQCCCNLIGWPAGRGKLWWKPSYDSGCDVFLFEWVQFLEYWKRLIFYA